MRQVNSSNMQGRGYPEIIITMVPEVPRKRRLIRRGNGQYTGIVHHCRDGKACIAFRRFGAKLLYMSAYAGIGSLERLLIVNLACSPVKWGWFFGRPGS